MQEQEEAIDKNIATSSMLLTLSRISCRAWPVAASVASSSMPTRCPRGRLPEMERWGDWGWDCSTRVTWSLAGNQWSLNKDDRIFLGRDLF